MRCDGPSCGPGSIIPERRAILDCGSGRLSPSHHVPSKQRTKCLDGVDDTEPCNCSTIPAPRNRLPTPQKPNTQKHQETNAQMPHLKINLAANLLSSHDRRLVP